MNIPDSDLRIDTYPNERLDTRSDGIIATHIPSGVYIACDTFPDQRRNMIQAIAQLKALLTNPNNSPKRGEQD